MLNRSAGVEFVGLYASFPVGEPTRRVGILKAILDLEGEPEFKRIKYGQLLGRLHTVTFSEEKLGDVLRSLETGESDYLQLFPYRVGEDWVQSFKASISVNFQSGISRPHKRAPSPIDSKFGDAGTVNVLYPQPRFVFDSESDFQTRLLRKIKELFVMEKMNWAFVNRGFHFIHPTSVGTDDIFQTTKVGFPITAFDADLNSHGIFFREFVKGAFWANFLNPLHVAKLGGLDLVKGSKSSATGLGVIPGVFRGTVRPSD